jgi:hypothetical protein
MSNIVGFSSNPVKVSQEKAQALGLRSPLFETLAEETNTEGQVLLPGDPKLVQRVLKRQTLSNRQKALQARFMPKSKMNMYKQQRATENYLLLNRLPAPLTPAEERNIQLRRRYGWATNTPGLSAERKEGQLQLNRVIATEGRFGRQTLPMNNKRKTSKFVRAAQAIDSNARFPLKLKRNRRQTRRNRK